MSTLSLHPLAQLFPEMSASEYTALRDDIRAHGLRERITTWRGQVIDGRHRLRACQELGVMADTWEWDGDESDLPAYVVSLNLHRRHLDESQRGLVTARLASLPLGTNQHSAPEGVPIGTPSLQTAANLLNVSRRTAARAKHVLTHGTPTLVEKVERGEMPVSLAAQLAEQPPEIQDDVLALPEPEQRPAIQKLPTAAKARQRSAETGELVLARDGRLHDSRTPAQLREEEAHTARMFKLLNALRNLASMPYTPADYLAEMPEYFSAPIAQEFEAAERWFIGFASLWRERNVDQSRSVA